MAKRTSNKNDTNANLGFEAKLWAAADALRNNMDAAVFPTFPVLGIRGTDVQIAPSDTSHTDRHPDMKADFMLAFGT